MNNSKPTPTITVKIDLCNPGQFFACCGLLELAHRLTQPSRRATGWFDKMEEPLAQFNIEAYRDKEHPVSLNDIVQCLHDCCIIAPDKEAKDGPLSLGSPFDLYIDWRKAYPQNKQVKTWAGQQSIFKIITALHNSIKKIPIEKCDDLLLNTCNKVTDENNAVIATTAIHIASSEDAIDAGFSMDAQKGRLMKQPAVFAELFALIGLQRFCPQKGERRLQRIYSAWQTPLTALLAAMAVCQDITGVSNVRFVFDMYERDSEGRYKSFSLAKPLKGGN